MGFCCIIAGLTSRRRKLSSPPEGYELVPLQYCLGCRNWQPPTFIREDTWFSAYFCPIFRVNKGHLISVVCSNCNSPMALSATLPSLQTPSEINKNDGNHQFKTTRN